MIQRRMILLMFLYLHFGCAESLTPPLDSQLDMSAGSEEQDLSLERTIDQGAVPEGGAEEGGMGAGESDVFDMFVGGQMQGGDSLEPDLGRDCGEFDQCGVSCVDLSQDPSNCGGCGRTCLIPNATAGCVDGNCVISQCDHGFADRDGLIETGCEREDTCQEGVACETQCGSEGAWMCDESGPICEPPRESCNLIDDDCDGLCDEDWRDEGCRVGVHRGYGSGEHIYTTRLELASGQGHMLERENYFYLYPETVPNSRPVFFCRDPNTQKPFLSNQTDCGIARAPLQTLGFWLAAPECDAAPLHAMYHTNNGDYFYTTNAAERDNAIGLGYQSTGIAGYVWLP